MRSKTGIFSTDIPKTAIFTPLFKQRTGHLAINTAKYDNLKKIVCEIQTFSGN